MIKEIINIVFVSILVLNNSYLNADLIPEIDVELDARKTDLVEEVTSQNFEEEVLNNDGIVLVDFYATWCTPCNELAPVLEKIAKDERKVKIVKVDIDKEKIMRDEYNIVAVPTMILMKDGKELDRKLGFLEDYKLTSWFEEFANEDANGDTPWLSMSNEIY